MKGWVYACLIVWLLLAVAPAGALVPDSIEVRTSVTDWVTAGSDEPVEITVLVKNSTFVKNSTSDNTSFEGIIANFTVDGEYGTISPAKVRVNSCGEALATFKPGTRSGVANITVSCGGLEANVGQGIDHAEPHRISAISYKPGVTAGTATDITVRMEDRYGNVVDGKREKETVDFMVGSPDDGAKFAGGTNKASVGVDDTGNATAKLNVSERAGENIVLIQPPEAIADHYIIIHSVADCVPAGITRTVNPSSASAPANGKDSITVMYELTDEYGNPAGGQALWVNASVKRADSPDEHYSNLINSSYQGEVWVKYGPEDSAGIVTLTATAAANVSVTDTTEIEFTSTEPVMMVLTASPQTMVSRDRNPDVASEIRARVMDIRGNPVEGEMVTFEIISNCSAPYNQTLDQKLESKTATTDSDGYAVVRFLPGAFTDEDRAASGIAVVQATWKSDALSRSDTQCINLTWMNYPYLSVETEVSSAKISVNSGDEHTTNKTYVTIRLKGDGYAMQPDPIDVVLVVDRSGSMEWDIDQDKGKSNERLNAAKAAASTFISQMNPNNDRVGLVSFSSSTTRDNELGDSFEAVTSNLDNLRANGATQLRRAIYEAILMQNENDHSSDAVKAVIVMTDGEWNSDGSPIGRGTGYPESSDRAYTFSTNNLEPDNYRYYDGLGGTLQKGEKKLWSWFIGSYYKYDYCTDGEFSNQNMSRFAAENGVKLYMITFAFNPDKTVSETMEILSTSTGGFYEHAGSSEKLTDIYRRIAGELKTEAGVNTSMTTFRNVEVNGEPVTAAEVFDYKYEAGRSTTIESWIKNETGNSTVIPFETTDQSDVWERDRHLHFDIGTIHLGQTWETTFCLAANSSYVAGEGNNINIFGPGALISFNNDTERLEIPDTYITIFPDMMNTGITTAPPTVVFTKPESGSGPYSVTVPLTWEVTYDGTEDVDITLKRSRREDMRSPTTFSTTTLRSDNFTDNTATDSFVMDARDLSPGQYWITVTASVPGIKESESKVDVWLHTRGAQQSYIKIG